MNSPFKFLNSYEKKDKDIFFGRDKEIELLYDTTFKTNLILVYGQTGTGKTSIIQCGLANRFRETDWFDIYIRRRSNINVSLHREIRKKADTSIEKGASVTEAIRSLYLDFLRPVYLIFDQFEELFTLGTKKEQEEFFQIIADFLQSGQSGQSAQSRVFCKILFVMREEYIALLYDFEKIVPELFDHRIRIELMHPDNVQKVIRSSAKAFDIKIEPPDETIKQIIENNQDQKGEIQLPYLQVYLDQLYRKAAGPDDPDAEVPDEENIKIEFTPKLVRKIGKMSDVMATFLDEQIDNIEEKLTKQYTAIPSEVVWQVLNEFATGEGTNLPMQKEKIYSKLQLHKDTVDYCLTQLGNARILNETEKNTYEIAHDTLAQRINDRRGAEEKILLKIEKLVKDRVAAYEDTHALLTKGDLGYIGHYENEVKSRLDTDAINFIKKSKKRVSHRRRAISIYIAAIIIIILSLIYYAMDLGLEKKESELQADFAEKQVVENQRIINKQNKENERINKENERINKENKRINKENKRINKEKERITNEKILLQINQRNLIKEHKKIEKEKDILVNIEKLKGYLNDYDAKFRLLLAKAKEVAVTSTDQRVKKDLRALLALTAFRMNHKAYSNLSRKLEIIVKKVDKIKVDEFKHRQDLVIGHEKLNQLYETLQNRSSKRQIMAEIFEALREAHLANDKKGKNDIFYDGAESWAMTTDGNHIFFNNRDSQLLKTSLPQLPDDDLILLDKNETVPLSKGSIIPASCFAASPNTLFCGTQDGRILSWRKSRWDDKGKPLAKHNAKILSMVFSKNKNCIVYSVQDKVYINYLTDSVNKEVDIKIKSGFIRSLEVIEDNNESFLIVGDEEGNIFQYNIDTEESKPLNTDYNRLVPVKSGFHSIAYDPTRNLLALANSVGEIFLFPDVDCKRITSGAEIKYDKFDFGHKGIVRAMAFSPRGKFLASGGMDGTLMMWDLPSGKNALGIARQIPVINLRNNKKILSLVFDINGEYIIFSDNQTLRICPTSPEIFYNILCNLCKEKELEISEDDWEKHIGKDIKQENFTICSLKKKK